ncbi:MAG: hypothetical protein ACPLW7_03665 [Minisyncoccia bacterium]|jgi:hypothetical protein
MLILNFTTKDKKKCKVICDNGEDLLVSLDKFLKKNKMKISQVKDFSLDTSQEKSVTSIRIAQAILKALNIAKECY